MPNNNWNLGDLLKPIAKVKLKGGVVGKLSLVMIVSALALATIAIAARNPYVSGGVAILLFILVMVLGNRLVNFANQNPQAALFEGAEADFLLSGLITTAIIAPRTAAGQRKRSSNETRETTSC